MVTSFPMQKLWHILLKMWSLTLVEWSSTQHSLWLVTTLSHTPSKIFAFAIAEILIIPM